MNVQISVLILWSPNALLPAMKSHSEQKENNMNADIKTQPKALVSTNRKN